MKDRAPPSERRRRLDEVAKALRRRFPSTTFQETGGVPVQPTGVPDFDSLLPGGGLPLGRASLVCGPPSSGRASLALAVATAAKGGRPVGWIDTPGTFHPPSASSAGLDLDRVLLVQPGRGDITEAVNAAVLLLRTGALAMLVLDVSTAGGDLGGPNRRRAPSLAEDAAARLGRSVRAGAFCLVLSDPKPPPCLFRAASLTIALDRRGCIWKSAEAPPGRAGGYSPRSLGGLAITATVVRSRLGGEGRAADLSLTHDLGAAPSGEGVNEDPFGAAP